MPLLTIKQILYATDFSESALPACDYALTMARLTGARLHVLHVIGELNNPQRNMLQAASFEQFARDVEIHSVKEMETFCNKHLQGQVDYSSGIVIGNPFQEIIKKAEELGVGLIVMGTHGRTGIEHVIVGSTAERVVRRSRIPVLTVRCPD